MTLNKEQVDTVSRYFSDISKILFASTVIGFFIPTGAGPITFSIFFTGAAIATGTLAASIYLQR